MDLTVLLSNPSSLCFDEPGILCKPAGIDVKQYLILFAYPANFPDVLHGNRLATSGIVGNGHNDHGYIFFSPVGNGFCNASTSIFPLNGAGILGCFPSSHTRSMPQHPKILCSHALYQKGIADKDFSFTPVMLNRIFPMLFPGGWV